MKVRPKDLSYRPGIDTRAISLGIFHADSMMKNPGGRARYKYTRLNSTPRVDSFQSFRNSSRGTRVREGQSCVCPSAINWSRSVECTKQLRHIPYFLQKRQKSRNRDPKNFQVASHPTKCLRLIRKLQVLWFSESLPDSLKSTRHSGATDVGMPFGYPLLVYLVRTTTAHRVAHSRTRRLGPQLDKKRSPTLHLEDKTRT